jgi:hypothetical protein
MTPFYKVNFNLNTPHIWYIDTAGRDPKWLVEAMNTTMDAVRYFKWAQDEQGVWWLMVEWKIPYDHDTVYARLNAAILAALDGAVVLHGVA